MGNGRGGHWAMRLALVLIGLGLAARNGAAQGPADEAWRLEGKGDAKQVQTRLQDAAASADANAAAVRAYAEFLDRFRDPGARAAYAKLAQILERSNAPAAERASVNRRLAVLDLVAGDRDAAAKHLTAYATAGGQDLVLPEAARPPAEPI